MDILNIKIDKNRNLDFKNSPECTVGDLLSLAGCLIAEITNQTGKSTKSVLNDIKRAMKVSKVWKK